VGCNPSDEGAYRDVANHVGYKMNVNAHAVANELDPYIAPHAGTHPPNREEVFKGSHVSALFILMQAPCQPFEN